MSREAMWERVRMAWAMLAGQTERDVRPGRAREAQPSPKGDEPEIAAAGFADEAMPWLDAVYRFSLRLTRGDRDEAEDLVQDTFLRAHRFWHTYRRGSNAKSWLFTICRNTWLHQKELIRNQREQPEADLDARMEALVAASASDTPSMNPEVEFFHRLLDDQVVAAIDDLPDDFRDVLVLSDLGDLKYGEIAEVLDIPVGTAKSRLFRARRLLQERLREFALAAGYLQEEI
ncbi:MAG TPA: sigma-70 family RNA polymerase sigma factor [Longimicrobiales bacterium]|nr:sigma-70 family RNA polymerase sigma factor [Longimicrobiales bacterium]